MIWGYDHWKTTPPPDPVDLEEPPEVIITCEECGGEGQIEIPEIVSKWSDDPYYCRVETCKACRGQGVLIEEHPGDRLCR
jgi:DnaJ-class molecular chaperone